MKRTNGGLYSNGEYEFWSIGSCTNMMRSNLDVHSSLTQRCCLPAGDHILKCIDLMGDGWNGGYLKIGGHTYCDDFVDVTALRMISTSGKLVLIACNVCNKVFKLLYYELHQKHISKFFA